MDWLVFGRGRIDWGKKLSEQKGAGWRRGYRWPLNLLLSLLYACAAAFGLTAVALLVLIPTTLLQGLSVGLSIVVGGLTFGAAAVSVFRYGKRDRVSWWFRLCAPLGLVWIIWLGGRLLIIPMSDFENDKSESGRLVTWAMLDAVPLLDLDRMLDYESPLDDWGADVGWVLVFIRVAVLVLLVGLVTDVWRWAHDSVQEHGVGVLAREAGVEVLGWFDGRLTWRRWVIALVASSVSFLALFGITAAVLAIFD